MAQYDGRITIIESDGRPLYGSVISAERCLMETFVLHLLVNATNVTQDLMK